MMAFGYTFLCGRQGAEGYIRETSEKRIVFARGLKHGEACALYAVTNDGTELCERKNADTEGRAEFTAKGSGSLFVCDKSGVLLWEGDDDVYLRASSFLISQYTLVSENDLDESKNKESEKAENDQNIGIMKTENLEKKAEKESFPQEKVPAGNESSESNVPYTLRAPGAGEAVDILPER